jgi:hypothetical protein
MAPGADFGAFVTETGTGDLPHLDDESGELWARFGTEGRSTFMFVNQDGTYELTSYGQMDQARLEAEVDELLAR